MKELDNIQKILNKKSQGQKITMLTAYDYAMASIIDEVGVDMILVGDSVANVVLGLNSTTDVGMTEMLHHAKAVRRAVKQALVIGDMPFESYQKDISQAVINAKRFMEEAGCDAIKLEWFNQCPQVVESIVHAGISVMGHVGLTPQRAEELGGMKVQGKDADSAHQIIEDAKVLEDKGCFSVVLECIPEAIAKMITQELSIPTIGIGAGVYCDGQVLVTHDILGLSDRFHPKFVKQYVDLKTAMFNGIKQFCQEVHEQKFPNQEHSYSMKEEELKKLKRV
ncbi:3-methyl-2-oxobutanoate hydroxymethyltransferase [hydrothermal vent metagenome]|uniref:3-methyl-2-oxobutanoate hydroxymethyltransferase n=1 Tax=hydrothermal vent metagenome TaxID=652676 RepID=A0A3B1DGR4_9ZZZZ